MLKKTLTIGLLSLVAAGCQNADGTSTISDDTADNPAFEAEFSFGYTCNLYHITSEDPVEFTEAEVKINQDNNGSFGQRVELDGYTATLYVSETTVNDFKTARFSTAIGVMENENAKELSRVDHGGIPKSVYHRLHTENGGKLDLKCSRSWAHKQLILNSNG